MKYPKWWEKHLLEKELKDIFSDKCFTYEDFKNLDIDTKNEVFPELMLRRAKVEERRESRGNKYRKIVPYIAGAIGTGLIGWLIAVFLDELTGR